ncbi:MAG: hypothetical protein HY538_08380 [Deltaproteobacteria bacterium]|nr:hypothetical protein [Deltaproteobacteria bacterium]
MKRLLKMAGVAFLVLGILAPTISMACPVSPKHLCCGKVTHLKMEPAQPDCADMTLCGVAVQDKNPIVNTHFEIPFMPQFTAALNHSSQDFSQVFEIIQPLGPQGPPIYLANSALII